MKLICTKKKPAVNLELPALCTFRSGKGYLWSLIRDRLQVLQDLSDCNLSILDAACHALITRRMFPTDIYYYGIDISESRLKQAYTLKLPNDILYRADLTRPFPLEGAFDAVVSCNTMSHLPTSQQPAALDNLIKSLRKGGDIFINYSLDIGFTKAAHSLLSQFETVEPVYFDSFLSASDEESNSINETNVSTKIFTNEVSLPNDASLHRQVLFHARNKLSGLSSIGSAPRDEPIKILNQLPNVHIINASDDRKLIDAILSSKTPFSFILTSGLYESDYGRKLLSMFSFPIYCLDISLDLSKLNSHVCVLGLENGWSVDLAADRLAINRLREVPNLAIYLSSVSSRNGSTCNPSLILKDY